MQIELSFCCASLPSCSCGVWLVQVFVEYVMLAGVNDGADQAHQLGQLLQGRDMIINLIPWNPVYSPDISFEAPASSSLAEFQHIVRNDYGLPCTIRQEKGQDISGMLCPSLGLAQSKISTWPCCPSMSCSTAACLPAQQDACRHMHS